MIAGKEIGLTISIGGAAYRDNETLETTRGSPIRRSIRPSVPAATLCLSLGQRIPCRPSSPEPCASAVVPDSAPVAICGVTPSGQRIAL